MTDWLTDDERRAWIALSGVIIKLPYALDANLRRQSQLSFFEYLVLSVISETPEHTMAMSELAMLTNASLSRLSHVVTRLEDRGWLRRRPCPGNGRVTNVTLTDDGFAVLVDAAPGHVANARDLVIDALTPEQVDQLTAICRQILGRLDPDGEWPPGPNPDR